MPPKIRPPGRLAANTVGHPMRLAAWTLGFVAMAHVTYSHVGFVGFGDGPSMLPTFQVMGDGFVVSMRHRRGRGVAVGDCVVYRIPVKPGEDGVKRVIGMPGDYVLMNSPDSGSDAMIQVPKGHCWIVGDNLPWSLDSRDYGPLPLALIKGKVISRLDINGWNPFKWFVKLPNGLTPIGNSSNRPGS